MKKLLIPIDFSETSNAAIEFGVQLAEKCGYQIILHHAVDFMHTYDSMYVDAPQSQTFNQNVIDDMEVRLENTYRKYQRDGLRLIKVLTTGSLVQDIRKLTDEEGVDLIVMGTKGATGLKEFFVGSNTEKVVRLMDIPVISIPVKIDLSSVRRIMVPVDISEIRPSFLKEIALLQQLFSASIEFVWVKTPHNIENVELIEEEFNNLLNEFEIASSSFSIVNDVFPQDGLLEYVSENETDLVAMATHARRGIAHWFSGSLTEDLMNHSPIPIWSLKINEVDHPMNLDKYQHLKTLENI